MPIYTVKCLVGAYHGHYIGNEAEAGVGAGRIGTHFLDSTQVRSMLTMPIYTVKCLVGPYHGHYIGTGAGTETGAGHIGTWCSLDRERGMQVRC